MTIRVRALVLRVNKAIHLVCFYKELKPLIKPGVRAQVLDPFNFCLERIKIAHFRPGVRGNSKSLMRPGVRALVLRINKAIRSVSVYRGGKPLIKPGVSKCDHFYLVGIRNCS